LTEVTTQRPVPGNSGARVEVVELPPAAVPHAPAAAVMWRRALTLAWLLVAWLAIDRLTLLLLDYWLLEELGYPSIFWTNFRMQALLWVFGGVVLATVVYLPARAHPLSSRARRVMASLASLAGVVGGYAFSRQFAGFFGFFQGRPFGQTDPVFNHDIGFYVFDYPVLEAIAHLLVVATALGLAVSGLLAYRTRAWRSPRLDLTRPARFAGVLATPCTVTFLVLLGISAAADTFLGRYDILYRDNSDATVFNGSQALDVEGFFSHLNLITLKALALLAGTLALAVRLRNLHARVREAPSPSAPPLRLRTALSVLLPGLLLAGAFSGAIGIRNTTAVVPNQPIRQLPYIQRHIDATRAAYGLDEVEVREFRPAGGDDPLPTAEELLASPTLRNGAPLWPGYVSWMERVVDPHHVERLLLPGGGTMIYGPTMETFSQEQKLRAYYDFLDVDTVLYDVGGEPVLFASAVRETPVIEPQPWLVYWGQRLMLFTHGHGLVMAPLGQVSADGGPAYASSGIPATASHPALATANPAVYYGEGSASMAYTNVKGLLELDYPTDEGRAEVAYAGQGGVRVDSLLKRLVLGYRSGQLFEIAFSGLITKESRAHYYRTPLERVARLAPFLHLDGDPYAVAAGGGVTWMVNGMTHTDRYPYSRMGELGDKADRRSITPRPVQRVNYVRDSVKATVDAYDGRVKLYRWQSEPVVDTWAEVYPELFADKASMPADVRAHVQYPSQLFHLQFDDLYIYYHMADALEFFNLEDAWDDGDDVVGPVLAEGDAITFSIEAYPWLAETGRALPASSERVQFALSKVFTNEAALNLRAITTAYQRGDDYGRLSVLQVPKGVFYPGPEQADAAIDQDAFIAQQIGFWNRQGLEAIRGHTTPLVIGDEVIYVEPIFTRSKQNRLPKLQRVIVVFRGQPYMGRTLEEAVRFAVGGVETPAVGQPLFPLDS
jgi:uncharacterized protein